jgi:hypothetical protein
MSCEPRYMLTLMPRGKCMHSVACRYDGLRGERASRGCSIMEWKAGHNLWSCRAEILRVRGVCTDAQPTTFGSGAFVCRSRASFYPCCYVNVSTIIYASIETSLRSLCACVRLCLIDLNLIHLFLLQLQVDTEVASGYGPPYVPARGGNPNTGAPPAPDLATALVSLPPFPPKSNWLTQQSSLGASADVVAYRTKALQIWIQALCATPFRCLPGALCL